LSLLDDPEIHGLVNGITGCELMIESTQSPDRERVYKTVT
jgi:hypothetical protein